MASTTKLKLRNLLGRGKKHPKELLVAVSSYVFIEFSAEIQHYKKYKKTEKDPRRKDEKEENGPM